jgi:carboxymethylenebutenolidase
MLRIRFIAILSLLACLVLVPTAAFAQDVTPEAGKDVNITSGGKDYQSYLAAPSSGGPYPAVVLIHSFNGLEQGYRTMTHQLAAEGFVVLAVGWQTFERSPSDDVVKTLVQDSITFLKARSDVDAERIGLTGFCAGGRYTMLLLPQIKDFKAGVAWYGFPYNPGSSSQPADLIKGLTSPMLIIHGTNDQPSPIANIYKYATALQDASANFELKVYSGEPHGFMLRQGQLREDEVAQDAFNQMAAFFQRKLAAA